MSSPRLGKILFPQVRFNFDNTGSRQRFLFINITI